MDSAVAFNKTKRDFLKIATRFNGHRVFFPQRQLRLLTLKFEQCVHKESFIAIIHRR